MLDTASNVVYKVFGLKVLSEIALPELLQLREQSPEAVDIFIQKGELSKLWNELSSPHSMFVVNENLVMFDIPDIALFSIQGGTTITFQPKSECDEAIIRLYILGTCMGALLMQRKIFPIHGSAIAINGKAYAIIGESGAGKSTLASVFLNQGYQLLSDDVIAVSFSDIDNSPYVIPSYPQQKLWKESLNELGMEASNYIPIYQRETKFVVPVPSKFSPEPLPLAGIYELVKVENGGVEISRIEKLERLNTLVCHTYRNFLIPKLGLMEWHFTTSSEIINHVSLYKLRRSIQSFTAFNLAKLILESIKTEEITHVKPTEDLVK